LGTEEAHFHSVTVLKKFSDNTRQAAYTEKQAQLNKKILNASEYKQKEIQKLALD